MGNCCGISDRMYQRCLAGSYDLAKIDQLIGKGRVEHIIVAVINADMDIVEEAEAEKQKK